jgi:hypothetical protein
VPEVVTAVEVQASRPHQTTNEALLKRKGFSFSPEILLCSEKIEKEVMLWLTQNF